MFGRRTDHHFGWRAGFVFLAAVGAVLVVATRRLLAETNMRREPPRRGARGLLATYVLLLADRGYLACTLAVGGNFAALMAYAAGGPFVFIDLLGLSPAEFGMLAVFSVAGFLVGSLAAARLSGRAASGPLLVAGLATSATGGGAMLAAAVVLPPSVVAVVAPMAIVTAGMGVVLPVGMAAAMAPFPQSAGAASAVLGFVQMLVAGLASLAVGVLPHTGTGPMAAVIAATSMLALLAYLLLRPRPKCRGMRRGG